VSVLARGVASSPRRSITRSSSSITDVNMTPPFVDDQATVALSDLTIKMALAAMPAVDMHKAI